MNLRKELVAPAKRIVVKVGTSVLAKDDNLVDRTRLRKIVDDISHLARQGRGIILVTSGAIGAGMGLLGMKRRPRLLPEQQAAAAIGQSRLMKIYDELFASCGYLTAQILLTAEDLHSRQRYLNARNTIFHLLEKKVIPIVNENDTVSVDEIKFGDNDLLATRVALLVNADLLIILSDVEGLYRQSEVLAEVAKIDSSIERLAKGKRGETTVGGMRSKLAAARMATTAGIPVVVASGKKGRILERIIEGEKLGTLFLPGGKRLASRSCWIAFGRKPGGRIVVDSGAAAALISGGRSLLSSGVVKIEGDFKAGEIVSILDEGGKEIARGLVNYSAGDCRKIRGLKSSEFEKVLGHKDYDELIHRDNLVMLSDD